jgi:hypothetical protein
VLAFRGLPSLYFDEMNLSASGALKPTSVKCEVWAIEGRQTQHFGIEGRSGLNIRTIN